MKETQVKLKSPALCWAYSTQYILIDSRMNTLGASQRAFMWLNEGNISKQDFKNLFTVDLFQTATVRNC